MTSIRLFPRPSTVLAFFLSLFFALGVYSIASAQPAPPPVVATMATDAGPSHAEVSADDAEDVAAAPVAAVETMPDPVDDPNWFVARVRKLWASGAITSALVLAAFGVVTFARKKVKRLGSGRVGVGVSVAAAILATLATAIVAGATLNVQMIASAVLSGVLLYLKSEAAPTDKATV